MWLVLLSLVGFARDRGAPVEDRVALAATLLRDGDWESARDVLAQLDPAAKDLDVARYWTLTGLVSLRDQRPADAADAFGSALAVAVEGRELLELHLARARLATKEPRLALDAVDRSGEVGAALPGTWLLRAQAEEALGNTDGAFDVLSAGAEKFPDQPEFLRQQVFLLVRLTLFREARGTGEALLSRADAGSDDAIALSEALARGGETREAATLLEAALLEHGDDRDLLVQAARASIDAGQPRNAGRFLERAAVLDPALAVEAAEAYRRAGDLDAALRLNGVVLDPVVKARQRLGLLLEAEAWDRALSLEERLVRLGLTDDDGVTYGLAWAAFRLGDVERADRLLAGITDPETFRRATELRRAMAACADGSCL